jgi:hypothetical protein
MKFATAVVSLLALLFMWAVHAYDPTDTLMDGGMYAAYSGSSTVV